MVVFAGEKKSEKEAGSFIQLASWHAASPESIFFYQFYARSKTVGRLSTYDFLIGRTVMRDERPGQ